MSEDAFFDPIARGRGGGVSGARDAVGDGIFPHTERRAAPVLFGACLPWVRGGERHRPGRQAHRCGSLTSPLHPRRFRVTA